MQWRPELVAIAESAIGRADAGAPTTLLVEGEPGIGKSAYVDLVVELATERGFAWRDSESYESTVHDPLGMLAALGVDIAEDTAGAVLSPVIAAQRLRTLVDDATAAGPLLITIDDLQWSDAESVEGLVALLSRAAGDRLLMCVASRPLAPGQHGSWERWSARQGRVERVALNGLDQDEAVTLVRELRPALSREVASRLWEHTGGNPLYLGKLASEYTDAELAAMRVLPAPAEFARHVAKQLDALDPTSRELAQALAVLGTGWTPLRDAGVVAAIADPARAAEQLAAGGLSEARLAEAGDHVRLSHSLVRAAIYQATPSGTRQAMHARASEVAQGQGAALEHRVAAVAKHDDGLAGELEEYAVAEHSRRAFRSAAHYLRLASAVSGQAEDRDRRWLDSLVADLLGGERASVRALATEVAKASDVVRGDLVLGLLAMFDRRVHEAAAILGGRSTNEAVAPVDALVQHRIESALAWSRLNAGAPETEIQEALDRARQHPGSDPTLSRLAMLASAQLIARHAIGPEAIPGYLELADSPAAVPTGSTPLLAWRGVMRATIGQFAEAIDDLTELLDRMQQGLHDFSGGTFHVLLARSQWFTGDWTHARVNLRLAADLAGELPPPMITILAPLVAIGEGDFAAADPLLAAAREAVGRNPWLEACDQLAVVEIIRQHAAGTTSGNLYASVQPMLDAVRRGELHKNLVWALHAGIAAAWAGAADDARACADLLAEGTTRAGWTAAGAAWLRGLAAETDGDGRAALIQLRTATASESSAMPLYRAHQHVDHARIAHLMRDPAAAAQSLDIAAAIYQRLGASPYVQRIDDLRQQTAEAREGAMLSLSDRERDVLTLVTSGMSYAQIARDLFITQSTVSYHLGNIYAKADVTSRHQLTALVREDPRVFGLPQFA